MNVRVCSCRILLLGCVLVLAACEGNPRVGVYEVPATACCKAIYEIQFRPIAAGEEAEFSLSPTSPSFEFAGRRQHFVAVEIPRGFNLTAIQVRSKLSTSYLPNATAVYPDFIFFDEHRRILSTESADNYQAVSGFFGSGVLGRFGTPANARYFVAVAGEGRGRPLVYAGNGMPYSIRAGALGEFTLRLFGETTTLPR